MRPHSLHRAALTSVLALCVSLFAPAPAYADDARERGARLTSFNVPSRFVDIGDQAVGPAAPGVADRRNNLGVVVRLPKGYAQSPRKRYPVLYLLHGAAQAYDHWAAPEYGDIDRLAKGFPGIIVMPQGGVIGFYSDWFRDGRRSGPGWESYYLRELIPAIERRYRIRPGRQWHSIAGLSMGGFGAMYLASQRPGYFGTAASFSGVLSPQDDAQLDLVAETILPAALPGFVYRDIFGPAEGFYATSHNPSRLMANLAHTRLFASAGNATPCVGDDPAPLNFGGLGPQATPIFQEPLASLLGPGLFISLEQIVRAQTERFLERADAAGVRVRSELGCGLHWWDSFTRGFSGARDWGLFGAKRTPRNWTYTTSARRGVAWDVRFRHARPTTAATTLTRDGRILRGRGEGRITIRSEGCSFTARLPFRRGLDC